jgi:hypothetical protein
VLVQLINSSAGRSTLFMSAVSALRAGFTVRPEVENVLAIIIMELYRILRIHSQSCVLGVRH